MQTSSEAKPAAAAEEIVTALRRLTVLRPLLEEAPFSLLYEWGLALESGALRQAMEAYHALCAALIQADCRAASGDLWTDYLLYALLERENDFSRRALANRWNDAVAAAMANDLEQLQKLSRVTSALMKQWAAGRLEELKSQSGPGIPKKDDIAAMSEAVWSGNGLAPRKKVGQLRQAEAAARTDTPVRTEAAPRAEAAAQRPALRLPVLEERDWPTFRYALQRMEGEYVSDAALEEIYRRLLEAKDWSRLLDDIWSFHGTYGTGGFLKHRAFYVNGGGALIGTEPAPCFDEGPRMYQAERERILAMVIRFMQGERSGDILVSGGPGTGKTATAIDMYYELPELRLIIASDPEPEALHCAVAKTASQPTRILLLLDNIEAGSLRLRRQMAAIAQSRGENLLVMAAARTGADPAFPNWVQFPDMQPREFMQLLRQQLQKAGITVTEDMLQNACIDCAAQKRSLCCGTALALAREIVERG